MTSNNALKFGRHLQIGENYTIVLKTSSYGDITSET